jgi:hypothetical protein
MNSGINSEKMKEKCENHEQCMKLIQAVLDGSATEAEMNHFKNNMDECKPCIEGYELEKSIKHSLQDKVEKKCCPSSTINQLKLKLGITALFLVVICIGINSIFCH